MIPKNNKSHALEKNSYRQAGFLKKVMHQTFSTPSTPPPPPTIISKASPSLKDTILKDRPKEAHFSDIVTGLTMGSTTFEEVGVW